MTALAWMHAPADIPDAPLKVHRAASAEELRALAEELGLIACRDVTADYAIRRIGEARYLMSGAVTGSVTQACVVTLEPVEQRVEEKILVEFAAEAGEIAGDEAIEVAAIGDEHDVEPLGGAGIEAGRIVFETFASAIDPYPRKPGATFQWQEPTVAGLGGASGPFAGLARLKK